MIEIQVLRPKVTPQLMGICIATEAGAPMQFVNQATAIAGKGLEGDRYGEGRGSFNKKSPGRRQVTFMNYRFVLSSSFIMMDTRRNMFTLGVELMWLIGREFKIGDVTFKGVKYCEPCNRPSKLSGKPDFDEVFHDGGGLVAEVLVGGIVRVGDAITPPPKEY
jgi:hypothetical protein